MNKQDIEKALEELKGKEFNTYGFGYDVFRALTPEFKKAGINCDYDTAGYLAQDTDHQTVNIKYCINGNSYIVGAIKVKKTKGKYHSGCFSYSGYYDWTISGFEVEIYGTDGTIETRVKEIEAINAARQQAKKDRQAELADVVKLLMKETGKNFREVMNFAQEINNYRYSTDFENKCLQNN